MTCRRFTLAEIIVAMSITAVIIAGLTSILMQGMRAQRVDVTNTVTQQQLELTRRAWQGWAQQAHGLTLSDGELIGDVARTERRETTLILHGADGETILRLPEDAQAELSLEADGRLALLTLRWHAESLQVPSPQAVRLVAALAIAAPGGQP